MQLLKNSLIMVSLLFSAIAMLAVVSIQPAPAQVQGNGDAPVGNGDVDCNGRIDVTDAVILLRWLFQNGQPPCALAESPEPGLPVGTVLPYFGDSEALPSDWVLCDGRDVNGASPLFQDANPDLDGFQVPDLRGSFLRGADADHAVGDSGGNDEIAEASVSNRWGHYQEGTWTSWDESGNPSHIIGWNDGHGNAGSNNYSLARSSRTEISYWTEPSSHDHGGDNRPKFTSVEYMIKVR